MDIQFIGVTLIWFYAYCMFFYMCIRFNPLVGLYVPGCMIVSFIVNIYTNITIGTCLVTLLLIPIWWLFFTDLIGN